MPESILVRRLRETHRIGDVLYDVERTFTYAMPLKDATGEWLVDEDLVTTSVPPEPAPDPFERVSDVSFDMSGACNLRCVYCFENDIGSRIGPMSETTAAAAVDFVFREARHAEKVTLHFGSGEPLLRVPLLRRIVADAEARALESGQQIAFELTTNGTLVTRETARFFAAHPFQIHVSCDGPEEIQNANRPFGAGKASYAVVRRGLDLLIEHIPERTTVNAVLAAGTRLIALWDWVRDLGARRIIVIKVGAPLTEALNLRKRDLDLFRVDLESIADDLFDDVEAGRTPIDYQPLTKVVRRLLLPDPQTRYCHVGGSYVGIASDGRIYPCFRHLGVSPWLLGNVHDGLDDEKRAHFRETNAASVDRRPICNSCWARYLCGGGCYADSTVYGPDPTLPQTQHCPFWQAEIEAGIRLFRRLVDADPQYCFTLFGRS